MQTDYSSHEDVYQRRKARGDEIVRWTDPTPIIDVLTTILQRPYVPKSGKLLELGCGGGELTLWLAEQGYEVYGVDIAPTAIASAQDLATQRSLKADFRVGDVLTLSDFPDNSFDFVLDGLCLHCIIGQDRKQFFANVHRVLKPSGFFFVNTMCSEPPEAVKKLYDPQTRCLMFDRPSGRIAQRYYGLPEDILEEIRQAALEILHWEVRPAETPNDAAELLVDITKS